MNVRRGFYIKCPVSLLGVFLTRLNPTVSTGCHCFVARIMLFSRNVPDETLAEWE